MLPAVRTFGDNLKLERERRRITQVRLAEWLALRQAQVSSWEKGRRLPEPESVRRIAAALSRVDPPCSPKDLLAGVITEYDRLRGSDTPSAPPVVGETLTPDEKRALRSFRLASDVGRQNALGLLADVAKAFPRAPQRQSTKRFAQTREGTMNKVNGKL